MQTYKRFVWTLGRFEVSLVFDMGSWGLEITKYDLGDGDMLRYVTLGPLTLSIITLGQPADAETQSAA